MDTYRQGEIAECCWVTPPDIAILANIGDQHLERFAGPTDHSKALSEVFTFAKPSAILVADGETLQTLRKQTGFVPSRNMRIEEVSSDSATVRSINMAFALKAAEILAVPVRFKDDALVHAEEPERRKRKTHMYGYDAIDDSYNISFATVSASLVEARAYASSLGKKLLVVTAGIPELSKENRENQRKLGQLLLSSADHTYVLKSMFYEEICSGLWDDKKYTLAKDLNEFVELAPQKHIPTEYVLLVLPELTDLYY
jgi:UDP-N-acetylmuramyl pentapeptide synthase